MKAQSSSTTDHVIRPAAASDIPALVSAICQMAEESEGRKLDSAVVERGVNAVFEEPKLGTYWVITHAGDNRVIGSTLMTVEWSDWHNAPYWWMQSVFIDPEVRGQGLMGKLIDAIEAEARKQNVAELRLYVDEQNERAIRSYQKSDFRNDHYRLMAKTLN